MRHADNRPAVFKSIIAMATLSLIAAMLTGLTATAASAGPGYQKPSTGQCRNLTAAQARAATNSTTPISCATSHTAHTVGVSTLSAKAAKASKKKIKAAQLKKCQSLFNKYVGGSAVSRAKSAFALRVFSPTKAQKKKGARWFRCDAVLPRSSSLTPITTTKKPLLSSATSQALCWTSGGSATTCDAVHSHKATTAFKITGKKYPGAKKAKSLAKAGCDSRISGSFKYDAPTKSEWDLGKRYAVCLTPHTLPPPPPPPAGTAPETSLIVPTGNAPLGTPVTLRGEATDDVRVTAVEVSLRNSGGLYLQDNLTTFNSTVNYLPLQTEDGQLNSPYLSWTVNAGEDLPVGTFTARATVRSSSGLSSAVTDTFGVTNTVDNTDPVVTINTPNQITSTTSLDIIGEATDNAAVASVVVRLRRNSDSFWLRDNGSFASGTADLSADLTGQGTGSVDFGYVAGNRAVGTYLIRIIATDTSGNATTQDKTITVIAPPAGSTVRYEMNEAPGATTMVDADGNGPNATINQAGLDTGVVFNGATGYQWAFSEPASPPAKPERVISVPDSSVLDANNDVFTIEMRYRTSNSFGNIIQKGQSGGAQWKIQAPGGFPSCLFKSSAGTDQQIAVKSTIDLSDNQWHTLKCVRSGNNVTMSVDGVYNGQKNAPAGVTIGNVANNNVMSIGGKANCDQVTVTCDYFTGHIDYVRISHG